MKTLALRLYRNALGAGSVLLIAGHAALAAPVADPEPKPYMLFMRTDVSVEQDKALYPIEDVSGNTFIINVKGRKVQVPMVGPPHRLEFSHELTLARKSASVSGLTSERAYTPRQDPIFRQQRESMAAAAAISDNASLAQGQFIAGMNHNFVAFNTVGVDPITLKPLPTGAAASASALSGIGDSEMAAASQAQEQADSLERSDMVSGGYARLAAEDDMRKEQFDAVEVRFEVSSPVLLEKPYVVIITRFHGRDYRPGMARNSVYARALNPIGSKPTKVDLLQGGFPLGFTIEDLQVHLYDDGKEVPTDMCQNRAPLTRDDAFQYLKIDYLNTNKGRTLPATAALGLPTMEERLGLTTDQWKAYYYVKVSAEGLPLGTYMDEACTQPVNETVGKLAQNVRYYPALDNGRQVEGVARMSLRRLPL